MDNSVIDNLVNYVPSFSKLSIRDLGTKGNSIILNLYNCIAPLSELSFRDLKNIRVFDGTQEFLRNS